MRKTFPQLAAACLLCATPLMAAGLAQAQDAAPAQESVSSARGWQACQTLKTDPASQLACFQKWADAQPAAPVAPVATVSNPALASAQEAIAPNMPTVKIVLLPTLSTEAPDGKPVGCRDNHYSELSRFWELQRGTDCDTFALRGYRPISLAAIASSSVDDQPTSPSSGHTATTAVPYKRTETKLQLSVRTKLAKGLLKDGDGDDADHDSLWFGYTQQSYWQLFNGAVSRPFRTTDHEPEIIYVYPHQIALPGGWEYRLTGAGLVHQSNGQSLPLSRSWNRFYLMGAAEKTLGPDSGLTLQGRVWERLRESSGDDDNPGIQDYIGRAELSGSWRINKFNTTGITVRHSLRNEARGSVRLDWMLSPTSSPTYTGLRYHLQLFNGYGDSLVDYNRKRSVLSVGLSLVDW